MWNIHGQTRSAVGLGYFFNDQSGTHREINLRVMVYKTFFVQSSFSTGFDGINILRLGVGTQLWRKEKFALLTTVRIVNEKFRGRGNSILSRWNIELPIEGNYDLGNNFHLYGSIIPTYNSNENSESIFLMHFNIGAGYSF